MRPFFAAYMLRSRPIWWFNESFWIVFLLFIVISPLVRLVLSSTVDDEQFFSSRRSPTALRRSRIDKRMTVFMRETTKSYNFSWFFNELLWMFADRFIGGDICRFCHASFDESNCKEDEKTKFAGFMWTCKSLSPSDISMRPNILTIPAWTF